MTILHSPFNRASLLRILAMFLLFTALAGLYLALTNQGRIESSLKDPNIIISTIPFHLVLKKHDPNLHQELTLAIQKSIDQNDSLETLGLKLRTYLEYVVGQRIPYASNPSVVRYMQITVEELQALQAQGQGYCHQFLYPESGTQLDLSGVLNQDLLDKERKVMTEVIRSSYESPNALPNQNQAIFHVQHVLTRLQLQHGQNLKALTNPVAKDVDKEMVCTMTIAFFQEILKLPESESGMAIRYIIQNSNPQPSAASAPDGTVF